ncbi:MAG: LruC domain-containing protein [Bacteroidota bacterium]
MKYPFGIKSAALALSVLGLAACNPSDDNPSNTGNAPDSFNYNTTRNASLTLSAGTGDDKAVGATVIISSRRYAEGNSIDTLAMGATDADGKFTTALQFASTVDTLWAHPMYAGLYGEVAIPVGQGGQLSANLYPTAVSNQRIIQGGTPAYELNGYLCGPVNNLVTPKTSVIGKWDANGTPLNTNGFMVEASDVVSDAFKAKISDRLPESVKIPGSSRADLIQNRQTNLHLNADAEVWLTFVSEGASYRNALGYIAFEGAVPATLPSNDTKRNMLFPNCSFPGSGGDTRTGDKVSIGKFKAGTTIVWFIVADGFEYISSTKTQVRKQLDNQSRTFYSVPAWNPETTAETRNHIVQLQDDETSRIVLGFEDINRQNSNCDQDFNDVLFFATANPYSAIDDNNIPPLNPVVDTDGDGVPDTQDAYPTDPDRAYNNYSPNANDFASLCYEDLWPSAGDYDMNDLVVRYNYNVVTNASNKAVELIAKYKVDAIGASYHNGFGIQFDAAPSKVTGVTYSNTALAGAGLETGVTDKATVNIFQDAFKMVTWGSGQFFNTEMSAAKGTSVTQTVKVSFTKNALSLADLGAQPYNPFIYVNKVRGNEVHLPGYKPTAAADVTQFGKANDKTNPATGVYYKDKNNMPFALHILSFKYPVEKANIKSAYLKFASWAQSSGTQNADWYSNTAAGYRDASKIYSK